MHKLRDFKALSFQFSTSVRKKHKSIKLAQKPTIIGYFDCKLTENYQKYKFF